MLKFGFAAILVTGLVSVGPAFAEPNGGGGIGRGCTLDPFNKTMRCIDFDNCTTDKNGKKTCPVVVTSTGKLSARRTIDRSSEDYLVVTLTDASVVSY